MRISVVVPSYRRPLALAACIPALLAQTRPADEIIVVVRDDDHASRELLATQPMVDEVTVSQPGAVWAMTCGALTSTGDVICFTDDDARPSPGWLAGIEAAMLADPHLGAVGGRDIIHEPDGSLRLEPLRAQVGIIEPSGRLIGNHHLGTGQPRPVDVLKGVNSAYRREALALPVGLRGAGTQIHFEVAMGIKVAQAGYTLRYDPALTVDHYPEERQDADKRGAPPRQAVAGHAYNLTASIGLLGTTRLIVRWLYATVAGDRAMPGIARAALLAWERDPGWLDRLLGALSGNTAALLDGLRGRRPTFTEVASPPR